MMLSFELPAWLDTVLFAYADVIQPILTTVIAGVMAKLIIMVTGSNKLSTAKFDVMIESLKLSLAKEDLKPEVMAMKEKLLMCIENIKELKMSNLMLAEMFVNTFEATDLSEEAKAKNREILAKMDSARKNEEYVKELEDKVQTLSTQLEEIEKKSQEETVSNVVEPKKSKKTRR